LLLSSSRLIGTRDKNRRLPLQEVRESATRVFNIANRKPCPFKTAVRDGSSPWHWFK
jgi:hypothetical protein